MLKAAAADERRGHAAHRCEQERDGKERRGDQNDNGAGGQAGRRGGERRAPIACDRAQAAGRPDDAIHPLRPEAGGDRRDDQKGDDQDETHDLEPDYGDGEDDGHQGDVDAPQVDAGGGCEIRVEGGERHRPA